jgi:hypothetical protein
MYGAQLYSQDCQHFSCPVKGNFSLMLPNGTSDIAALVFDSQSNLLAVKIVRSQTVPGVVNQGNPITVVASDATTPQPVTSTGVPNGFTFGLSSVYYVTANAVFPLLYSGQTSRYGTVSTSEAQAGDYYSFTASAISSTQQVITQGTTSTAGPIAMHLPAPMTYSTPTPAKFPVFTIDYAGFSGDAAVSYSAQIGSFDFVGINDATVTATSAYQNGGTTLAIPDLTSLPGFALTVKSGWLVQWTTYAYGGAYQWYELAGPNAGSLSIVENTGTYVEP